MSESKNNKEFKVGKLAALANVGLGTVRHYQKMGLLPVPPRPVDGGPRKYSFVELNRLLLIKNAQALGFSLKEIAVLLRHRGEEDCLRVKEICVNKQQELEKQIRAQETQLRALNSIVACCSKDCGLKSSCALILGLCGMKREEVVS